MNTEMWLGGNQQRMHRGEGDTEWSTPGQKSVWLEVHSQQETGNCRSGVSKMEAQLVPGKEAKKM